MTDLELSTNGERIVWRGKPKFNCFVLETIFNPLFPFALLWAVFDLCFLRLAIKTGDIITSGSMPFVVLFFAFHLMPVWIYLAGVATSVIRYNHTEYIITERGIYISGGVFAINIQMKPFTDLSHVNIHKGIFDQILGVGDVVMVCEHTASNFTNNRGHNHNDQSFSICDIEDYQHVFQIIKDMQTDIYSDTMYPNALRPDNNPGYSTKYNKY